MTVRFRYALAALGAGLLGCGSPTSAAPGLTVRTDSTAVRADSPVAFSMTNLGVRTVEVERCCTHAIPEVDRWQGSGWSPYRSAICTAVCVSDGIAIASGARVTDVWATSDTGTYRLRLGVRLAGGQAFEWTAASNAFEVR